MSERVGRGRANSAPWMLVGTVAALLLLAWQIYQAIWGFGGFYTHVRHIPVPDNLVKDSATSLIDIDAYPRQARRYTAAMSADQLIAFNQRELPEYGWRIVSEEQFSLAGFSSYCISAQRGRIEAYIRIFDSDSPTRAQAFIYVNEPNSSCMR